MLAHKGLGEIAATYNIYRYEAERKAALELWVNFLDGGDPRSNAATRLVGAARGGDTGFCRREPRHSQAYYGKELTSGVVVTRQSRPSERDNEDNRVWRRIADILLDPGVVRAIPQMLTAKLAPAFKAKHAREASKEAVKFMAHCAARWAIERKTVRKSGEVKAELDLWKERICDAKNAARTAREGAEQARELRQPEYAEALEAEARLFDAEAATAEIFLEAAMTMDDPCCVTYRPADPAHPSSRAAALKVLLQQVTVQVFGRSYPTWAVAFANAATGGVVTRDQRRDRQKLQHVS